MATSDAPQAALVTEGGEACPVCGARAAAEIDVGDFALYRCSDSACGCWSSDAQVRGAQNSFEPESYFENADLDRDKWDALLGRLAPRRDAIRAALDVGCGTGAFLAYLRDAWPGIRRAGIEPDAGRADRATRGDPEARIHAVDALAGLDAVPGPFDLVTLWDVLEHVPAPARLLSQLARVLAPDGRLYVQTIHEESVTPGLARALYRLTGGQLRGLARRTHEPHHLVFFTERGLERAAARAGLRIREVWFDRLHLGRMDGNPLLTHAAAALLRAENVLGGGLFINLLLEPAPASR